MSQLALVYESQGNNVIKSRPIPEPINGHVQVRVEAAGVIPIDYKIYDDPSYGSHFIHKYPTVLGIEAAGEVTKLGPGVGNKFKVGDRVAFVANINFPEGVSNGDRGAFQQYTLADIKSTTKIPSNVNYDAASTFAGNGNTTACIMYDDLKFKEPWLGGEGAHKGEKIAILGGSSSLGSYLIQFAVLSGLEVITTSSPAHFDYLKSLGATTVIDRSASDVAAQILAAAGGPLKYVVDSISLADTQLLAVEIVQRQGQLVLVLAAHGWGINERFWDSLEDYFARGVIKLNRPTVLPGGLRAWEEAFDLQRKGKVSGTKIVIRPQETQ
ncbi:chaperonin 10-like protein [Mycena rosella]|uniref:Chaperonin 10-like protein n=1 Tax=Mycena rosella TaxID=1033263 RepID=A0AAD7GJ65_MYCRO|nr:chaperonin 10-like protein [Mycena rosella]